MGTEYDTEGDTTICQHCGGKLREDNPPTDSPEFYGCCSWACVEDYHDDNGKPFNTKARKLAARGIEQLEGGCDDIWDTEAYRCGDRGCGSPGGWHKRTFWCTSTREGFTVDEFSDGDHEPVTYGWTPDPEEIAESWKRYRAWVAEHGVDPLGDFFVKADRKVRERWQFKFGKSIVGVVLREAKRAGKRYMPRELPQHVREYLNLHDPSGLERGLLGDFKGREGIEAFQANGGSDCRFNVWTTHHIEHRIPRKPETVRRELVASARKG